ncbi:hypothetical protein DFH07DRAFT_774392 [Mycena maculata]|uniref:Uncharacterized protein n=1 Tax=Mycena maculata TaxID=230809 RepID=A0AAD7IXC8_9AGAR|nr:hypothetical protein DFH07DRAFT_774392 [Mycena maculata]
MYSGCRPSKRRPVVAGPAPGVRQAKNARGYPFDPGAGNDDQGTFQLPFAAAQKIGAFEKSTMHSGCRGGKTRSGAPALDGVMFNSEQKPEETRAVDALALNGSVGATSGKSAQKIWPQHSHHVTRSGTGPGPGPPHPRCFSIVMAWLPRIFCLSPSSLSMAGATKAQKARQNNLHKARNSIKLLWKKCQMKIIPAPDCMDPVNLAHVHLKELLEAIQDGSQILDPTPETATERSLNQLNYKDFPALHCATASLSVKSKDKKLDIFFRARVTAMYHSSILSGGDLIYVNHRYSGHHMLPPSMIAAIKASIVTY